MEAQTLPHQSYLPRLRRLETTTPSPILAPISSTPPVPPLKEISDKTYQLALCTDNTAGPQTDTASTDTLSTDTMSTTHAFTHHSTRGGLCCAHELERGDCDCVNTFKQIEERGATMAGPSANPNPTPALANTVPIGLGSDRLMAAALEQDPMRDSVDQKF